MIYFNNAATSYPKAPGVAESVAEALLSLPGHSNRASLGYASKRKDCRTLLAELMQISDKSNIAYMSNATHALNVALLGFKWQKGDFVLATSAEHNSVSRPLYMLKKKGLIDYCMMDVDSCGRVKIEDWEAALDKYKPRLCLFTHASNVTGAVNDAEKLAKCAKARGVTVLLDASQTMGFLPVLPEKWGIDMVAFTGHKYLLGPQGTGGLYVSSDIHLDCIYTGGTGIHSDEDEMPNYMPLRLEAGTPNEHSFYGLETALIWSANNPINPEDVLANLRRLEEGIAPFVKLIKVEGARTPVMAFTVEGYSPEDMGDILSGSYDIVCRTGLHCAPHILPFLGVAGKGTVRFSISRFTTVDEIDKVIEAVEEIMSE